MPLSQVKQQLVDPQLVGITDQHDNPLKRVSLFPIALAAEEIEKLQKCGLLPLRVAEFARQVAAIDQNQVVVVNAGALHGHPRIAHNVELEPEPYYTQWWFWTAIAAFIAGGVVAGVILGSQSPDPVPGSEGVVVEALSW